MSKFLSHATDWLIRERGSSGVYYYLSGVYILKATLNEGFKVGSSIAYKDYEYKGIKIYTEVGSHPDYINGIPSAYILYKFKDESDFVSRPKL